MKSKFTPERIAAVCSITEYFLILGKNLGTVLSILPRMVTDKDGNYLVEVEYTEDGEIKGYKNQDKAIMELKKIPMSELNKLAGEIVKACGDILNPPSGGGLTPPPPSEVPPPPAG